MDIKNQTEPVKISKTQLDLVRDIKKRTGISISRFIEDAISEKIQRLNLPAPIPMSHKVTSAWNDIKEVKLQDLTKETSIGKPYNPNDNPRFKSKNKIK